MKIVSYSYARAPELVATRRQAIATFLGSSSPPDEDALAIVALWLSGLDAADTVDGAALREKVAAVSEVVILLAEPPPPPPPPKLLAMTLTEDEFRNAQRDLLKVGLTDLAERFAKRVQQ